jgi:peptide methionine sulfoxide reductase MsrA
MKQFLIFSFFNFLITFSIQAQKTKIAYFGSGCFWCVEAIFETVKGVKEAESGYCGGTTKNPTYEQICTGRTGHAETVKVTYDPFGAAYFHIIDDRDKKEVISAEEVYFNATEEGQWDIWVSNPKFKS